MSSPNRIRVLPEQVINQIAAGEVIERPAAAVKELLENSIDAGATQVEVEFASGGKTYIRIEDNGSGMSADDALLALERHATSKLRRTDDLLTLRTLGFRGEALPSIASISRFTLRTRNRGSDHGTELLVDSGRLIHRRQCALAFGTRIEVAHLFAAVPARRKFLKSDATEAAHIVQLVRLHALARPDVGFHLIENGRTVFRSAPCPTMRDRVAEIWGPVLARELIELPPVEGQQGLRLRGLLGKSGEGRATRRDMIWLMNGRPIENRLLDGAVTDAYEGHLPRGRYPLSFLFLEIDPAVVDVNIHPSKKQVRFGSELLVRNFVSGAVADRLRAEFSPQLTGGSRAEPLHRAVAPPSGTVPSSASAASGSVGPAAGEVHERNPLPAFPRRRLDAGGEAAAPTFTPDQRGPLSSPAAGAPPVASKPSITPKDAASASPSLPLRPPAAAAGGAAAGSAPAPDGASTPVAGSGSDSSTGISSKSGVNSDAATVPVRAVAPALSPATADPSRDSAAGQGIPSARITPPAAPLPSAQSVASVSSGQDASADAAIGSDSGSAMDECAAAADVAEEAPRWRFLSRLHREYALMQTDNGLVVMRLRAAHERVWFERVRTYFKDENRSSQQLLLPLSVEFDPLGAAAMHEHIGFFNAHGFEIEAFGRNFYRVHAHPGWLASERVEPFLRECVEKARRGELRVRGKGMDHEGLAKMAATRSIRMGDRLSDAEIEALVAALLRCEDPLTCPNGKPTLIEWTLPELSRRFGLS